MCEVKLSDLKEGDYVYRTYSNWGTTTITKYPIEKVTATGNIRIALGYYDSQGYAKGKSVGCISPLTAKAYREILLKDILNNINDLFDTDKETVFKFMRTDLYPKFLETLKVLGGDKYTCKEVLRVSDVLDSINDLDDNYVFTKEDFTK